MGYDRNDRRYGNDRDSRAGYGTPDDRGFFDRASDEVRSWFGDDEAERRRRFDERNDERYDNRTRSGSRDDDGGRYARYQAGGYSPPEAYPSWRRSNRDERGFSGSASPSSYHYSRADEDRNMGDEDYARSYGARGLADTGPGYGDDRARRNAEYRAAYGKGGDGDRGRQDDPHGYHSWRTRQIDSFDRDYDEYRRENQSRFESEFATWRQKRQTQRDSLGQAQEKQEVVGSDGTHVGTVDHIRGDRILLTKTDKDAGGHHHSIPSTWVGSVTDKVKLSKTAAEAQQAWRDEERGGLFDRGESQDRTRDGRDAGAANLNRSFSGTY